MKRIFIDTNIFLDFIQKRPQGWREAEMDFSYLQDVRAVTTDGADIAFFIKCLEIIQKHCIFAIGNNKNRKKMF